MPPGLGGLVVLVFEVLNCFRYFLIICCLPDGVGGGGWTMGGVDPPQVAALSSPCSDFISSLGATTAANMWVLSYRRPTYLLFPWELGRWRAYLCDFT